MRAKVVVLGGSFAGLTAAFDVKRELKDQAEVTVISRQDQFVFIPSLIWVVPGWRTPNPVTFDLKPALEAKGIRFVHARADCIVPEQNAVETDQGVFNYDYLVIATGPKFDWDAISGLGPHSGYSHSVCSLPHAQEAQHAFREFLKDPGPVVLGATQGASCFGAEYETAFNIDRALREAGVRDKAPVTFLTSEPFLGHFGIGGLGTGIEMMKAFFKRQNITPITNASVERVEPNEVILKDGRRIPFKYSIIIPPFRGVDAITLSPNVGNERGFIPVNGGYQHTRYPNIYAAGVSVAVAPPAPTPTPTGVPKTGYMSEMIGKVVAHNIAAAIKNEKPKELPLKDMNALCILDAGKQGVILMTDKVFPPRKLELLIPGPWSHWAKLAFEKYYIWKMRTGNIMLP